MNRLKKAAQIFTLMLQLYKIENSINNYLQYIMQGDAAPAALYNAFCIIYDEKVQSFA
ncbi:MAG: hypothetical protein NT007_03410 [Candidatus Kapabacteria bacterium]|nr:hypothetical protein [Candidatus Kapabacteria bacterium]